jgi:hypothetical protein
LIFLLIFYCFGTFKFGEAIAKPSVPMAWLQPC